MAMTAIQKFLRKYATGLLAALGTFWILGCETIDNPSDFQVDYTIVIKDAETKFPIEGVSGRFTFSDKKREYFKSDEDGIIEFSTYSLMTDMSFSADGFIRMDTVDVVPADSNALVNFRNLNFFMYSDTAKIEDPPEPPSLDSTLIKNWVIHLMDSLAREDSIANADTSAKSDQE